MTNNSTATHKTSFSQPKMQTQKSRSKNTRNSQKTNPKDVTLYKTELCRNWIELGLCRYGDKCRYAHGEDEMRSLRRHARYKTEICRAYHSDGTCPYGTRCTFIHDTETIPEKFPRSTQKTEMPESCDSLGFLWKSKLGVQLESTKQSFPVLSMSGINSLWSNDESSSENSYDGDEKTLSKSPLSRFLSLGPSSDSLMEPVKYNKPTFSKPFFFNSANSMWI